MHTFFWTCSFVILNVFVFCVDIEQLMASMSLEEKVGQMIQVDIGAMLNDTDKSKIDFEKVRYWIENFKIGSILNSPFSGKEIVNGVSGYTAREWRDILFQIQTIASQTNSKIPIIYGIDSIHGASYVLNATLFPQQIGLAATFNTSFAEVSGRITSKDTRAAGISWIFSPVLGIALQPLWARFWETFGECPYLASKMGASLITGLQSLSGDSSIPRQVCVNHFIHKFVTESNISSKFRLQHA